MSSSRFTFYNRNSYISLFAFPDNNCAFTRCHSEEEELCHSKQFIFQLVGKFAI